MPVLPVRSVSWPVAESGTTVMLSCGTPRFMVALCWRTKVPVRPSYALGARIHYLCSASLQVDLPSRAAPFIEQINERFGTDFDPIDGETVQKTVDQINEALSDLEHGKLRMAVSQWN